MTSIASDYVTPPQSIHSTEITEREDSSNEELQEKRDSREHEINLEEWSRSDSNPINWSRRRRWVITMTACYMSCMISLAGSAYSVGEDKMVEEFGTSKVVVNLGISLFTLSMAIFPLFLAPLGESVGRKYVYMVSYAIFYIFFLPVALAKNIQTVLVSRFICGAAGSVGTTMVGGTISDIWIKEERMLPMAFFALSALIGTPMGPTFFSWTGHNVSWRWIHWTMLISGAPSLILIYLVFKRETMPNVIRRKQGVDPPIYDPSTSKVDRLRQALSVSAIRPLIFLFTEPIATALCLWIAFAWSCLYGFLESVPIVFEPYGFTSAHDTKGLAFTGLTIGAIIGFFLSIIYEKTRISSNGRPEKRLGEACVGGILFTIGFFWYAWSAQPAHIHWIMPQIGTAILMTGLFMFYLCIFNYFSDCYGSYTSSAIAAQSFARNILATAFPLFSVQMYKGLTYPWASSLLGFIAALLSIVPFLLIKYGPSLRSRSKFASENTDK